ncbi:MAG: AAA family ATPase [Bauldia sp.]
MTAKQAQALAAGQEQAFAFLADPLTHGLAEPVKRIDTHAAAVFLAGPNVYKVKRAVRFPFMDQTTLEKRRTACETEVLVNRAFAPDLYLGTVAVTRAGPSLRLGGRGEAVEWAVHMRRFDENRTLDLVAERGEITPALIAKIADLILASHQTAKVGDGARATVALGEVVAETLAELIEAPDAFPAAPAAELAAAMRSAFAAVRPLLLSRGAAGRVRRCHGDLHLRNIALIGDEPILFDAIEFDESIATTDVLYDLAFALMDLCERRHGGEANLLLTRYLWRCEDMGSELAGLAALPLFLSLRAAVHAKIDAIRSRDIDHTAAARDEALRYFDIAGECLRPVAPLLVAVGGLSGTGKTTLAARIAPSIGRAPGAVRLCSDIERKRRFGVAYTERLPAAAYRKEVSDAVYASLRGQAETAIRTGHGAIVDAVHSTAEERALVAAVAAQANVRFVGLWLDAPLELMVERVRARRNDISDATDRVVTSQANRPIGDIDWHRLDASMPIDALTDAALAACRPERQRPPRGESQSAAPH